MRALILDLDDTLFPTRSTPEEVFAPVVDRVREVNRREKSVPSEILEQVLSACWDRPFDVVAEDYSLPDILQTTWHEAMKAVEVTEPLQPYPDVEALSTVSVPKHLVTTGYRRLQESKIDALELRPLFDGVFIDALGEAESPGKELIFKQLLSQLGEQPHEIAVVGDNTDSEIAAGKRLGMRTVQVLRDGVGKATEADHQVRSLWELEKVLR